MDAPRSASARPAKCKANAEASLFIHSFSLSHLVQLCALAHSISEWLGRCSLKKTAPKLPSAQEGGKVEKKKGKTFSLKSYALEAVSVCACVCARIVVFIYFCKWSSCFFPWPTIPYLAIKYR